MAQQPLFFNVRVLSARGFELQFAVHESNPQEFYKRVDAVMQHIAERGYKPIQTREAWLQSLTQSREELPF